MSDLKFRVGKNTIAHGGNRWKPIMMRHGTHSEVMVMVRTDEDEHNEIANGLCEYLNDAFDREQLPSEMAPHHLRWLEDLTDGTKEVADHPDFVGRAKYIITRLGSRFQTHITDGKDVMEVGAGYENVFHARSAAEAHLATNRALRKQGE